MAVKIPKSMLFRACVYPSPDINNLFVAHCLELDLIGEGSTPRESIVELIQAIELQIKACKSASQFFFPAPGEVWRKYKQAKNAGRVILQRIIEQAVRTTSRLDYAPHFENVVATSAVPKEYVSIATL